MYEHERRTQMKKRILSLLLSLIMVLSLLPTTAWAAYGENWGGWGDWSPAHAESLAWNYATITESTSGGFNAEETSIPSGATITVKVGETTLTQGGGTNGKYTMPSGINASNNTPVTISVSKGFYVVRVLLCCNDENGYNCQTSQTEQAFSKMGSVDGTAVTMTLGEIWNNSTHRSNYKDPYWLMVMVAKVPEPVYVGYDAGTLSFTNALVSQADGTWVSGTNTREYTTNDGNVLHTVLDITSEAKAAAAAQGLTFAGWKLTYYNNYTKNSNAFSDALEQYTDISKNVNERITLFTHAKLVAQWEANDAPPAPTTGNLTITKVLDGNGASAAANKEFTFTVKNEAGATVATKTITGAGSVTVNDLPLGTYTVTESGADITGYTLETKYNDEVRDSYNVTLTNEADASAADGSRTCRPNPDLDPDPTPTTPTTPTTPSATVIVTNTYTPVKTSVAVQKVWDDSENKYQTRPESITVQLLADGQAVSGKTATLNAANDWKDTFNDLNKYSYTANGATEITYTVKELDVDSNYTASVEGNKITNTLKTGDLTITKENTGATPASVTFNVTGPHDYNKEVVLNADNNWTTTLTGLPVGTYNVTEQRDSAKVGCYTLANVKGEGGVEVTANGGSITITNTYEHETLDIPVSKVWKGDEENQELRPTSITVNLMNGATVVDTKELTAENNWKATFEDVRKYDDNNALIDYTVVEAPVANYKAGVVTPDNNGGYTITNELAPTEYTATVDIEKIVKKTGGNVAPGKEEFVFVAYYEGTEKNVAVGEAKIITDGERTYTSEMVLTVPASAFKLDNNGNGTVTLYVSEISGASAGWTYDPTVYTLVMTVENYAFAGIKSGDEIEFTPIIGSVPDGQGSDGASTNITLKFTNEFSQTKTPNRPHKPGKPITSVKTGDAGVAMYAMSGLLSLGGAALFMKKRKDEE